jgi:hypothetical protein
LLVAVEIKPLLAIGALGLLISGIGNDVQIDGRKIGFSAPSRADSDADRGDRVRAVAIPGGQRYETRPFDRILVAGGYDVEIVTGDTRIEAMGAPDALARLEIRRDGDQLIIAPNGYDADTDDEALVLPTGMPDVGKVKIRISTQQLDSLALAGTRTVSLDKLTGGNGKIAIAGGGTLMLGEAQLESLKLVIAGAGRVETRGRVDNLNLTIAGSGRFNAPGLVAENAKISIAGSGDVAAQVDDSAKVSIAGSGNVRLSGNGTCKVSQMGSADVQCNLPAPRAAAALPAPAAPTAALPAPDAPTPPDPQPAREAAREVVDAR